MGVLDLLGGLTSSARILRQVDEILRRDMALNQALELILRALAEGIGADSTSVLMLARGKEEFVVAASHGLPEEAARNARLKLADPSVAAWVLKSGESLRLHGPLRDPRFEGAGSYIASAAIVPIYWAGECVGVLSASNRTSDRRFSWRDLRLVERIGSHISVLVERLRLERELAEAARENLSLAQNLETARKKSAQHEKLATLGQLAAGIAHEIRNPLSGIIGYTQLLRKSLEDYPDLKEDLDNIERETGRLRQLAHSMLGCARPAEPAPVSLNEILDMALAILRFDIKRHGARIYKETSPLPPLVCDPGQMEQVFINLILNALHSLKGRPEKLVTIRTGLGADGKALEAEVRDTGCGIQPEDLPRIFEPYFTTRKDGQGSGLGLAAVKEAVERHGGTIAVQSEVSAGTTIRLSFPRP